MTAASQNEVPSTADSSGVALDINQMIRARTICAPLYKNIIAIETKLGIYLVSNIFVVD